MLLLFEKGMRGGMCNAICKYVKANNKYMKNYDNTKESKYSMYVDASNLYGWAMCEKLPIDNFKWETDLSVFTSDFIKNYDSHSDMGYIFYVDIILKNVINYVKIYHSHQIEWMSIKLISLLLVYMIKIIMLYIFML